VGKSGSAVTPTIIGLLSASTTTSRAVSTASVQESGSVPPKYVEKISDEIELQHSVE
jgi:hypothetical protein